ncbi:MAG: PHP domain-containing protein [Elusimicrobia bacterium]|nr:PHP domain-containing protein [Elusimicrobiota bacterium]
MGIDLHIHTNASDGTLTAEATMERAHEAGLTTVAITDHDTTAGLPKAEQRAAAMGVELIPGVEINAGQGSHCHILGYWIDADDLEFQRALAHFREARQTRIQEMVKKLQRHGLNLLWEDVLTASKGESLGRPHIADALHQKGYVASRGEAFHRYLLEGGPAYVPSRGPTSQTAIRTIRQAKGIPVVAHPAASHVDQEIPSLVDAGLMGIEVYYPEHSPVVIDHYRQIAARHHLLVTGGSDFHGPGTGRDRLGSVVVPPEVLAAMKRRRSSS